MKRSSLLGSAAVISAAGLSAAAAALLRRLLRHGAVKQAVLPVTPVPPNTVTATAAETAHYLDPAAARETADAGAAEAGAEVQRPSRTWIVDNSADWDGSPQERVVPPPAGGLRRGNPGLSPA